MKTIITGLLLIASMSSITANASRDIFCRNYATAFTANEVEAKGMAALARLCYNFPAESCEDDLSQIVDAITVADDATQDRLVESRDQIISYLFDEDFYGPELTIEISVRIRGSK